MDANAYGRTIYNLNILSTCLVSVLVWFLFSYMKVMILPCLIV